MTSRQTHNRLRAIARKSFRTMRPVSRAALAATLMIPVSASAQSTGTPVTWNEVQNNFRSDPAEQAQIARAVAEWRELEQNDSRDFARLSRFLAANPGFPGEARLKRLAEEAIDPMSFSPAATVAHFRRFEPVTASGQAKYALALLASGQRDAAYAEAREAWRAGPLDQPVELRLLNVMPGAFTPADHDARMDALLWANATNDAARQLSFVSGAKRPYFEARLAMRSEASDASSKMSAVDALYRNDPGYIVDKATWLRSTGQSRAARSLLAQPRSLTQLPADTNEWYATLLVNAQGAERDGQYSTAYDIASRVDDAIAQGADIRDTSASVRDKYTDLVWLAGQTALYQLNRPADAARMFERYAAAPANPALSAKGHYWAGRAWDRAGNAAMANASFTRASEYFSTFYGMLARERLGMDIPVPSEAPIPVSDELRTSYWSQPIVRAAVTLGRMGDYETQTSFIREIAAQAETPQEHLLAADLATKIGRPDLGVMVARSAGTNKVEAVIPAYYPVVAVPGSQSGNWTMIHAISRQESQFDKRATSRVGARGMMQLMPATAREVARGLGLSYDVGALHSNPGYNVTLGSTYFQKRLDQFNNHALAAAAYNGGAGNVNKWIREFGDPRSPNVDIIRWIENIPYAETKYYVQYVLSNAVMYENMRSNGNTRPNLLSQYLGKRTPG